MKSKELWSYGLIGAAVLYYLSSQGSSPGGPIPNPEVIDNGSSTTNTFIPGNEKPIITQGGTNTGNGDGGNTNWFGNNGSFIDPPRGTGGLYGHGSRCGCQMCNGQSVTLNY